jgi:hypothetical protein
LSKHQENKGIRSQAGLAYVAILLLLTVLSTMGFAFLFKVGIETAATETRGKSMQVDYLAESAANHALWRLLNEPGFNPASDTYYMHSLGNGRYGYKIRKPTETTFATVATVGAIGDSVANQSYVQYIPSNVCTVYGNLLNSTPKYRRLIGAQWADAVTLGVGSAPEITWVEVEGCPIRKEFVGGIIDTNNNITLAVWNGTDWGNMCQFSANADVTYKCFDIAYESQSGDALVVGRVGAGTPLHYNIWDGSAWAFGGSQAAFSLPGGDVSYVAMASQPGSDEILVAVITDLRTLQLARWDGSAFHDLGTIEAQTARLDTRIVEIVYEHQSGDAMVVWARNGDSALKFRMWNGAELSLEGDLPDFNGINNFWIRGAADSDPTSDYIVIAAIDNFSDINMAVWDGDAWIDSREIETSGSSTVVQNFDVAWEAAGEDALIAWVPFNKTNVRSMTWKKSAALADCAVQEGPDLQNQGWLVRLLPISGTQKIVLLGRNNLKDLRYCLWTGDGFKGDPTILLEDDIPVQNELAFDLAEANVPRTGGTGSGSVEENQVPVVDAGPDQTVCPPTLEANLAGTVTDDGLPNPPGAVTTGWSQVSGPGTVTFDDASLVDATATFSEAGEYVLRLTANDSALVASDEVTIAVKESQVYMTYGSDTIMIDTGGGPVPQVLSSPKYKPYDGSAWGFNGLVMDLHPLVTKWMELEAAFNKEEMVMGATQDNDSLHLAVFDGTSWGNPLQFTSASDSTEKCYDIAYESQSGDALVVGRSGTSSMAKYTVWDGSTWTNDPPADAFDYGGGNLDVVEMESSPLSDEILVAVVDSGKDLYLYQWDGSSFNSLGLLDDWVTASDFGIVKIVYEQQSGDALIIWGQNSSPTPKYRTWDGSILGDEQSLPDFGLHPKVIRADADPASDSIFVAALDPTAHINVAVWDGNSWIDSREIETAALPGVNYCLDVAWMPSGNGVLVGWYRSGQNFLYYFDWTKGTALSSSSIQVGPNFFSTVNTLQLLPLKTRGSIMVVGVNGVNGLYYTIWDGAAFDPDPPEFIVELVDDAVPTFDVVELACTIGGGGGSDTDPPTPDPMTWASPPAAVDAYSITMTATTATDPSGVEYYFECTVGGGNDSGWQDSTTYLDTGLSPDTLYTYRVKARDKSPGQNETGWSSEASATTESAEIYVYDISLTPDRYHGAWFVRATVWIKDVGGNDISGALVTGDWSGVVSGTSMGSTGGDGKVTLNSPPKYGGGVYTFTVTHVSKSGYTYNPALNVETSDTIQAP